MLIPVHRFGRALVPVERHLCVLVVGLVEPVLVVDSGVSNQIDEALLANPEDLLQLFFQSWFKV